MKRITEQIVQELCHEIRTQLAVLAAVSEVLNDDLKNIQTSAVTQINMILKQAETQNNGQFPALPLTTLSPVAVVEEAVALAQTAHPGQTIRIVGETKKMVRANREAVIQILSNLLENALRYSPIEKDIVVTVKDRVETVTASRTCREEDIDGCGYEPIDDAIYKTMITVTDEGTGVAPGMHTKIFEEGYTADKDQQQGIGLTIARRVAESMEGTLVSDQNATGGSFTLTLKQQDTAP